MANSDGNEEAVIVHFSLSGDEFGTPDERMDAYDFEDQLLEVLERANVGELDGHEFGDGEVVYFMYGPSADALFAAIEPVLRGPTAPVVGYAIRRYGAPGAREAKTELVKPST